VSFSKLSSKKAKNDLSNEILYRKMSGEADWLKVHVSEKTYVDRNDGPAKIS